MNLKAEKRDLATLLKEDDDPDDDREERELSKLYDLVTSLVIAPGHHKKFIALARQSPIPPSIDLEKAFEALEQVLDKDDSVAGLRRAANKLSTQKGWRRITGEVITAVLKERS